MAVAYGLGPLLWLRHCRLVLKTTNREGVPLTVVGNLNIIKETVKVHIIRTVAKALRGTPEGSAIASVTKYAVIKPIASRERGEPKGIRTIAIIPSECRLKLITYCR